MSAARIEWGRIEWGRVLEHAADVVYEYATGVTLRQLFYRLVAAQLIPNTVNAYKRLSSVTAEARRAGEFPDLIDRGRDVHRFKTFTGPDDGRDYLRAVYRRDRTEGQETALYLGVEKAGIVEQLVAWFGNLGVPVLALGGYSSQSYVDEVSEAVFEEGRDAVLLYAGDFDPSGEDIDRDFVARTACWDKVVRVALNAEQVVEYRLPENPGKATDSRAAGFVARHGELVQVELDALEPTVLRGLYEAAIGEFWDASTYDAVVALETSERALL